MSAAKKPMRLPPLKVLRVRNPNPPEFNPCYSVMSTVLSCWASAGYTAEGCVAVEQTLRACMDNPRKYTQRTSSINYHLSRMHPKIGGGKEK